MRGRLPAPTAREIIRALERYGFELQHQTGSHVILHHPVLNRTAVVPSHRGDLRRKTVFSIIRQAGISPDELIKLL